MTETSRIRWEDKTPGNSDVYNVASIGYVGTRPESAFIIYTPDELHADWLLSVRLTPGSQFFYAASRDELKDRAGRWLAEFVSSLGAIFPDTLRAGIQSERDAQDQIAADQCESGHVEETERAYGRVEALDGMLAMVGRLETGKAQR